MHQLSVHKKKKIYLLLIQALSIGALAGTNADMAFATVLNASGDWSNLEAVDLAGSDYTTIKLAPNTVGVRVYTSQSYSLGQGGGNTEPTVMVQPGSTLQLNTQQIAEKDNAVILKIIGVGEDNPAVQVGFGMGSSSSTSQPTVFQGENLEIIQNDDWGIEGKGTTRAAASALTTFSLSNSKISALKGLQWDDLEAKSQLDLNNVIITTGNHGLYVGASDEGSSTKLTTNNLNVTTNATDVGGNRGTGLYLTGGGLTATLNNTTVSAKNEAVRVSYGASVQFTGKTTITMTDSSKGGGQNGLLVTQGSTVSIDHLDMKFQSRQNSDFSGALSASNNSQVHVGSEQGERSRVEVFNTGNSGNDVEGVNAFLGATVTLQNLDMVNFHPKRPIGESISDKVIGLKARYNSKIFLDNSTVILKDLKDENLIRIGSTIEGGSTLSLKNNSSIQAGQFAVRLVQGSSLLVHDSTLEAGRSAIYAMPVASSEVENYAHLKNATVTALQQKSTDPLGTAIRVGYSLSTYNAYLNVETEDNSKINADYLYQVQRGGLTLKAANSRLSGAAQIHLNSADSFANIALMDNSVWHLKKDPSQPMDSSYVHANTLSLTQSSLEFVKPENKQSFQQFAVDKLVSDQGVVQLWTELQDDSSGTDQLVIRDGTTGTTALRIMRFDDELDDGAQTNIGIKVVSADSGTADNTATTGDNAFVLDSGSTGYRASSNPSLVAGVYDYHLLKGGDGGETESWYLSSAVRDDPGPTPNPDPDPDPDPDPTPNPDPDPDPTPNPDPGPNPDPSPDPDPNPTPNPDPTPSPSPAPKPIPKPNVYRPEVDAYFANRQMAVSMQRHRWQERLMTQSQDGRAWARLQYKHESFDNQFGHKRKMHSSLLHFGSDVWQTTYSDLSKLSIGAMVLLADGKSKTRNEHLHAEGKVKGYNVGIYATWQQEPDTESGAYIDSWLMHGWFKNKVKGEGLAEERYNSRSLSASIESGYGFKLSESENTRYYLQPQAQVIWSHFNAGNVHEQTYTHITDKRKNFTSYRIGLRFKALIEQSAGRQLVPFAELNYWRQPSSSRMTFNQRSVEDLTPKNIFATSLGLDVKASNSTSVFGRLSYMVGNHRYRDSTIQLGINHRW